MKTLLSALTLTAVSTAALAAPNAELLVGTWNCDISNEAAQGSMTVDGTVEYKADQSAVYDMTMTMDLDQLEQAFSLGMKGTGSWRLEGDKLTTTTDSMDVSNAGEPNDFVDMMLPKFQAQQQQQLGKESTVTIVELTEQRLVQQPPGNADTVACTR